MVRVNNSLWGPTDGGFESLEEKAEENKNAEIKMTIWTIFKKKKLSSLVTERPEAHYSRYKKT